MRRVLFLDFRFGRLFHAIGQRGRAFGDERAILSLGNFVMLDRRDDKQRPRRPFQHGALELGDQQALFGEASHFIATQRNNSRFVKSNSKGVRP